MKIKKNGKVINLTEGDLQRIVKRVLSEQEEGLPSYNSDYFTNNPNGTMEFIPNKGLVSVNGKSYENLAYMDTGKSFGDFYIPNQGRASGNILGKFNYTVEGGAIKLTPTEDNKDNFCRESECIFNPKG